MREEDLSYFDNEEFKNTLRTYEEAMQQNQPIYMDADDLTDIAEYYMVNDQEPMANKAIALAVSLHPDSVDPQVFLSRQEMFHNRIERAHQICDAIPDQDDREVHLLRAELFIREEMLEKADEVINQACEKLVEEKDRFFYDAASIFMDYMQWGYALKWCNKLRTEYPRFRGVTEMEAEIRMGLGEYDEAIRLWNMMLDINAYNTKAWLMLAETQHAKEDYMGAIDSCEYLLAINEHDFGALSTIARCYFDTGEYTKAHQYFEKAIAEEPNNTLYHMHAMCLFLLSEYDKAKQQLQKACETMADMDTEAKVHFSILNALIESKLNNHVRATEILDEMKSLIIQNRNKQEYELICGQVMLENGFTAEAREHFEEAMLQSDDYDKTALIIGISYYENEMYTEAVNLLLALTDTLDSLTATHALPYLAMCYMKMQDTQGFVRYLRLAGQLCPDVTQQLFEDYFPGLQPNEYYLYAHKNAYGFFPEDE